jgi:HAD superfamily hydrolase (TIGR01490 family)
MNSKTKSYVAFFDLDRTVLSINSGSVLVREAHRSGLMSTSGLINAIYLSLLYKFHLRDTDRIISSMGKWMKGVRVDQVEALVKEVANKYLINAIRPEISSEISFHREKNAELILLSSVISEIGKPISAYLGFDYIICTKMQQEAGVFTGLPETKFCFEDEKRFRLLEYCKLRNYRLSDVYYYGDSISDLPALEVVGHPVCVTPDKKLGKIAGERGWEICDW